MKHVFKAFLGLAATMLVVFAITSCNNLIQIDEVESNPTTTSSSSSGGVTYALNADGTVTLNFSSLYGSSSSSVSRSISPSTPELYWTVYGSTAYDDTNNYAKYDADAASSGDLSTVWYGTKDKTTDVTFTIGAVSGRVWYFTAVATRAEQSTIYGTADTDIAKVAKINAAAIAKGTIGFTMKIDQGEGTVTLQTLPTATFESTTGSEITTAGAIVIGAVDASTTAKGTAYIPVSIPANWTGIKDSQKIDTVKLSLASDKTYTVTGIDTTSAGVTFAFAPELDPGTYDVELTFLHTDTTDSNTGDGTLNNHEVFSIHDTLTIKANYDSFVVSSTNAQLTTNTVSYKKTASADKTYSTLTVLDSEVSDKFGYTLTEALIKAYTRTTFYVYGDGTHTATAAGANATGSKSLPFSSVADAIAKIPQIADAPYGSNTTWTIIVDGDNTNDDEVNITMASTSNYGRILVKAYDASTGATIAAPLTIQTSNEKKDFAFILENITDTAAVTIGTPYFYLNKSVLSGEVTLLKSEGDAATTYDGVLNASPTDTVSKAQNITLEGTSGKFVVKRCTFNATTGLPEDDESSTFSTTTYSEDKDTTTVSAPFALASAYQTEVYSSAGYYRYLRVITDNTDGYTRTGVNGSTAIKAVGDLAVAYTVNSGSILYNNTTLKVETAISGNISEGYKFEFTATKADNSAIANQITWTVSPYLYETGKEVTFTDYMTALSSSTITTVSGSASVTLSKGATTTLWDTNAYYQLGVKLTVSDDDNATVDSSVYFAYTE